MRSIDVYMSSLLSFASRWAPPLEMRASATCLSLSTEIVTFAVMGCRRNFCSFPSLAAACFLMASLASMWRKVMLTFMFARTPWLGPIRA